VLFRLFITMRDIDLIAHSPQSIPRVSYFLIKSIRLSLVVPSLSITEDIMEISHLLFSHNLLSLVALRLSVITRDIIDTSIHFLSPNSHFATIFKPGAIFGQHITSYIQQLSQNVGLYEGLLFLSCSTWVYCV